MNRITETTTLNSKDIDSHMERITSQIIQNGSILTEQPEEKRLVVGSASVSTGRWLVISALLAAVLATHNRSHACA